MDRKKNFFEFLRFKKIQSYFSRIKKCNSQNKFRGFLTFLFWIFLILLKKIHNSFKKKREFFPWFLLVNLKVYLRIFCFFFVCHHLLSFHPKSGKEILIFFPFKKRRIQIWFLTSISILSPFKLFLTNFLGSTNSFSITVQMRPFSTSAQKILIFVLATTTKICTIEKSN